VPDFSQLFWPMAFAFASLVAAGFGLPIPEELPTIGAGIWVASNPELAPWSWFILPVCFVGILISDVCLYGIGRLWGTRLLELRWAARLMPPGRREHIQANYQRFGVKVLLMSRWFPGIRSPMFIVAGTMRLTLYRFIVADAIAAAIGHSALFFLAYYFGDKVMDIVGPLERRAQNIVRPLLIIGAILGVVAYLVYHFWKRPVTVGDPQDIPLIGPKVAAKIEQANKADADYRPKPDETEPSKNGAPPQNEFEPNLDKLPPQKEPSANGEEVNKDSPEKSPRKPG
jgi:membrane protein DedA with SNARE-associated domain